MVSNFPYIKPCLRVYSCSKPISPEMRLVQLEPDGSEVVGDGKLSVQRGIWVNSYGAIFHFGNLSMSESAAAV